MVAYSIADEEEYNRQVTTVCHSIPQFLILDFLKCLRPAACPRDPAMLQDFWIPRIKRGTSRSLKVKRGTSRSLKVKRGTSRSLKVKRGTSRSLKVKRGTSRSLKV